MQTHDLKAVSWSCLSLHVPGTSSDDNSEREIIFLQGPELFRKTSDVNGGVVEREPKAERTSAAAWEEPYKSNVSFG